MSRQSRCYRYDFRGHNLFPVIGSGAGAPFASYLSGDGGGRPTITGAAGGGVALAFDSVADAQIACLYQGNVLPWDIDELIRVEFIAKCTASLDSATSLAFGLASARNDTIDTIAEAALFRCIANNTLVVETDDGTNNNDDVATGQTMLSTFQRFVIDFATGIYTKEPPSVSAGTPSDVRFFIGNANGSLRRVASGTRFDMSNYTGGLQLFAQLQKSADSNTDSLTILEATVEVQLPNA